MSEQPSIVPMDLTRLLRGELPWSFLLEIALRVFVLYVILILATRLMGRRLAGALSRNELLAVVGLASAMGPAVQDPARGLLPPLLVASSVVMVQKIIARVTVRSRRFESLIQGGTATLIADGRVEIAELARNAISRERLFAEVRSQGFTHLGAVRRAYLEPDGAFTFVKNDELTPGLSVVPAWDEELRQEQRTSPRLLCANCGAAMPEPEHESCSSCGSPERSHGVEWP